MVKGIESFSKAGAVLPPRPVKGAKKIVLRVGLPLDLFQCTPFVTNSDFLISISLKSTVVNLRYFKLRILINQII